MQENCINAAMRRGLRSNPKFPRLPVKRSSFLLRLPVAAILLTAWFAAAAPSRAELKVATLHPVLTELAKRVGGQSVSVTGLVPPGADVHHFSPSPADVKRLAGAAVVLASGKHLENYLDKLRDNLAPGQTLVEVGRTIPSIKVQPGSDLFMCCPEHARGAIDPHWWNGLENMQRAAKIVAEAFSEKDPANAETYRANAAAFSGELGELKKWAKKEIAAIPPGNRKLATSHLALSYFAKEFGFKLVPVQGLSPEVKATSKDLAEAIGIIKKHKVKAVFPERGVNPKNLEELARETGVKFGGELVADGNGAEPLASWTAAFRHNVREIVKALR